MGEVKLAIIGTGAIASLPAPRQFDAARPAPRGSWPLPDTVQMHLRLEAAASQHHCAWSTDVLQLPSYGPDIVIEAASPEVIRQYTIPLLDRGVDLLVMSAGALTDSTFLSEVEVALRRNNRHMYVPSGAVGGLDILRAASLGVIEEVRLTTSKPASGVCGAPWFTQHPMDLAGMTERTVVFRGSVVEAVRWFPQNVNVAAVLGLAALGARSVSVEVAVDPTSNRNVHEIYVRGSFGENRFCVWPTWRRPITRRRVSLPVLARSLSCDDCPLRWWSAADHNVVLNGPLQHHRRSDSSARSVFTVSSRRQLLSPSPWLGRRYRTERWSGHSGPTPRGRRLGQLAHQHPRSHEPHAGRVDETELALVEAEDRHVRACSHAQVA